MRSNPLRSILLAVPFFVTSIVAYGQSIPLPQVGWNVVSPGNRPASVERISADGRWAEIQEWGVNNIERVEISKLAVTGPWVDAPKICQKDGFCVNQKVVAQDPDTANEDMNIIRGIYQNGDLAIGEEYKTRRVRAAEITAIPHGKIQLFDGSFAAVGDVLIAPDLELVEIQAVDRMGNPVVNQWARNNALFRVN